MKDRAYEIARNCEYDGYERALAIVVYKFVDKKTESWISENEELAKELHKPVIKKFNKKESLYEIERQYLGSRFC